MGTFEVDEVNEFEADEPEVEEEGSKISPEEWEKLAVDGWRNALNVWSSKLTKSENLNYLARKANILYTKEQVEKGNTSCIPIFTDPDADDQDPMIGWD
ncbi:hypothetical protein ACTQ56_08410 [[Clostridium] aminophilum]|uniref:hypothetical protein n=1 Tax=[Clostridium] aminophilum TaxID=1526 RepID=UPI003F94A148